MLTCLLRWDVLKVGKHYSRLRSYVPKLGKASYDAERYTAACFALTSAAANSDGGGYTGGGDRSTESTYATFPAPAVGATLALAYWW